MPAANMRLIIDRGHFSLQNNPQIEIHGAFTDEGTTQTALSYHYDLLAKEVDRDVNFQSETNLRQYGKDRQQEVHKGSSKELYEKLWLKIPLKMDHACAINTSSASQSSVDGQSSADGQPPAVAQSPNTSTRPNGQPSADGQPPAVAQYSNTSTQPDGPEFDPPSLRVIDSRQCSNKDCKEFVDAMMTKNGWNNSIREHIKKLIPEGDIHKTLDIGISLPDVGIYLPDVISLSDGINVDESTNLTPILVFFLGMPYFGIRKARGPSSRGRAAAEPESLSLSEYSSRGAIKSTYHSGNEVWVHRAWFMVFSNDMIAMFRSKEDNHPNLRSPLYACQERVCMFLVLINIISNILELSQKRFLIFLEEVHEKDSEIDAYILKILLGDRNKEKEKALTKDIWELERDVKNSKRVVQSQIDILGDVKKFYGDISSSIVPTREQISLALKRIEEIVKGLVEFSQRISYLLETLRKSKIDLLNALVEGTAKETIEATEKAATDTVGAIQSQRQVMSMLTILTTIFLPLGFFTSLYGMASDKYKTDNPQKIYWPGTMVGLISIGITVIVSLITLFVVLKSRDPKNSWKFWRWRFRREKSPV